MAHEFLSGVGLLAFAGISGFHFLSVWRVANHHLPALASVFAVFLILAWLGGVGLILYAIRRNKLKACFLTVFFYGMSVLFIGMGVLKGVPSHVAEGNWHDPQHRLTPDAKYVLHNHSNVIRALSEAEYRLYQNYAACYFSGGLMIFAAGLCLCPLDRDGQLRGGRRVLPNASNPQPTVMFQCTGCSKLVPAESSGRAPPWCPHCGASL
jgi:hypothetical protein